MFIKSIFTSRDTQSHAHLQSFPPAGRELDHSQRIMESTDTYMYFIILDGYDSGQICYKTTGSYLKSKGSSQTSLRVYVLGHWERSVMVNSIQPLKKQEAELLCALDHDKDRLTAFREREVLDHALKLKVSSPVTVEVMGEWCQGVIRYIGEINRKMLDPISGTFFGIELTVSQSEQVSERACLSVCERERQREQPPN